LYVKVSGTWRTVSTGSVKVAGTWRTFFTSTLTPSIASTVTISRSSATYPSTLTGTNFYWINSTSLTYVFQSSSDDVNFTNIGSAAVINNPSSGSSNTVTYALTLPDFPAFTSYYRFVVTAVNSTYSTSATSTSTSVSVNRPAPINTVAPTISPSSGTVGVTQYSVTSDGTWDPVDADGVYEYLWQSYDTPSYISAPGTNTLSTYTPPSDFLTLGYQSPIRCRVTAANATNSTAAFSNTATVLGVALTPTFGANTSTAGGFTGSVTNYNASYTWGISTNSGSVSFGTPSGSTYPFTVTGLSSSASATVTVTTSRTGYNSGSAQTTGTAAAAPSPPTINSSSATTTSITLNFSLGANSTSTRAYLNGGFDGSTSGTSYTFSGLSPGTAYTLALYGYNGVVQSTTSSGGSFSTQTGAALTPTFGANTSVSGGFTGSVTNYSASYTWGISTNSGSVSFGSPSGSTYPFTVSGLSAGASATVTVTTTRTGYTSGSANTTGTASVVAPSAPSPSVTSGPTQTTVTISWSAPSNGGSAITRYEAQLGSSGYVNIGNVLTQSLSGLTASTSYTYFVRAVNAAGTSTAGSVSFTTLAAPVPSVTQIQSTNTNAGPIFMSFAITCANALSCDVRVDRAASSATAPTTSYTPGTSTLLTLSGGSGTVNSTTTAAPAGSNAWYRIRVIPYTGASRTGTAGTQVASSWKRNTATSTTTTNPSPTPFGDASV
jgi:hypothetical protein